MIYWSMIVNSYLEARHNRVIHIALGFAIALIAFALFLGEVSLYEHEKLVKDIGLGCISILGIFVAIYLGVTGLYQELERRTIYLLVSKPVHRYQILLGRFLGMATVIFMTVLVMVAYLYMVLYYIERQIDLELIPAIVLILVEQWMVAAIAVFFSSFSTPFLSGFFTFGFFLIGRLTHELGQFGERSKNLLFKAMATSIQKFYDLEAFDLRTHVVHKLPVYREDFWWPMAYGMCFILALLWVSLAAFQKRDLK